MATVCSKCGVPQPEIPGLQFCVQCGQNLANSQRVADPPAPADVRAGTLNIQDSILNRAEIQMTVDVRGQSTGSGGPAAATGGKLTIQDSVVTAESIDMSVHHEYITNIISDPTREKEERFKELVDLYLDRYGVSGIMSVEPSLCEEGRKIGLSVVTCRQILLDQQRALQAIQAHQQTFESSRKKFRLRFDNRPAGDQMLSLAEVVAQLNQNRSIHVVPSVDVDQNHQWRPVWRLEEIFRHPELQLYCYSNGQTIRASQAQVCSDCGRVYRRDRIPSDGVCKTCQKQRAAGHREEQHRADLLQAQANLKQLDQEEWRAIPAGAFIMGSPDWENGRGKDERTHPVHIVHPFLVSVTPVTESLFKKVIGAGDTGGRPDYPQTNCSWKDAIEFCNQYSRRLGMMPVYRSLGGDESVQYEWDRAAVGVRLLTEAEWEYACRAGQQGPIYGEFELDEVAQFEDLELEPLKQRLPNQWGLNNMLGGVWELVWDEKTEYPDREVVDPAVQDGGGSVVLRGGSFADPASDCRCGRRSSCSRTHKSNLIGFRIAISIFGEASDVAWCIKRFGAEFRQSREETSNTAAKATDPRSTGKQATAYSTLSGLIDADDETEDSPPVQMPPEPAPVGPMSPPAPAEAAAPRTSEAPPAPPPSARHSEPAAEAVGVMPNPETSAPVVGATTAPTAASGPPIIYEDDDVDSQTESHVPSQSWADEATMVMGVTQTPVQPRRHEVQDIQPLQPEVATKLTPPSRTEKIPVASRNVQGLTQVAPPTFGKQTAPSSRSLPVGLIIGAAAAALLLVVGAVVMIVMLTRTPDEPKASQPTASINPSSAETQANAPTSLMTVPSETASTQNSVEQESESNMNESSASSAPATAPWEPASNSQTAEPSGGFQETNGSTTGQYPPPSSSQETPSVSTVTPASAPAPAPANEPIAEPTDFYVVRATGGAKPTIVRGIAGISNGGQVLSGPFTLPDAQKAIREIEENLARQARVPVIPLVTTSLVMNLILSEVHGKDIFSSDNSGFHGVLHGTPRSEGRALVFNGTSDYIVMDAFKSMDLREDMTIEVLAKVGRSVVSGGLYMMVWRGDDQAGKDPYGFSITDGALEFRRDLNKQFKARCALTWLAFDEFHVFAAVHRSEQKTLELWVDGRKINSVAADGKLKYKTDKMKTFIGAMDGNSQFFKGAIGAVRLFDRALEPPELEQDAKALLAPPR